MVSRYDTEGLRYEIEENEKLSRFIFNKNGDILAETDKEDNVVSRFVRGYEIVAADISEESNRYYYTVDEQGSTALITDSYCRVKNEKRWSSTHIRSLSKFHWPNIKFGVSLNAFGNVLGSKKEVNNIWNSLRQAEEYKPLNQI